MTPTSIAKLPFVRTLEQFAFRAHPSVAAKLLHQSHVLTIHGQSDRLREKLRSGSLSAQEQPQP